MQVLNGRRHVVRELAFSHCGRWLAAAGSDGGLHVWDTASPDGTRAAVGSHTGKVLVWDWD